MNTTSRYFIPLTLIAAVALSACDKKPTEETAGQKLDTTVASAQNAIDKASAESKVMGEKVETAVADTTITTKVKAALANDEVLKARDIHVETQSGQVTLTGTAPTSAALARASELAQTVAGVTNVVNRLSLSAS